LLSSLITSYATLFRSKEIPFLLLKPLDRGEVVIYKTLEAAFLSSWAFFFVIVPFVGAYAWHLELSPLFAMWATLFSIPFVLLCAGLGTLVTLLVVRWMPRWTYYALAGLVALGLLTWAARAMLMETPDFAEPANLFLTNLIPGLRLSMYPLWPSGWVAEGMTAMSTGQWGRGALYLAVLVLNTLVVLLAVEAAGRAFFHDGWQRMEVTPGRTRRRGRSRLPDRFLQPLPTDLRALVVKDVLLFFRDPVQWSQALIFFGILAVYFLNLRNLQYHLLPAKWQNLIVFLNVFSVCAVMCSFGSRFVYPQLSLEGQGFWILGRSPLTMGRVLLTKFAVALACMVVVSAGLMYISASMLDVAPLVRTTAVALAVVLSFAISGLSTGLGAVYLDLRHQNPAAILSSFGGTLNLVLSLLVMFVVIIPVGAVFHAAQIGELSVHRVSGSLAWALAWAVVVSVLAGLVPLHLGHRSLLHRDY
jgi:ABC-2 type transport system permease protein